MIALQFHLNGVLVSTAGLLEGTVVASASCTPVSSCADSSSNSHASFTLGGVDLSIGSMHQWFAATLKTGDEIRLRFVDVDCVDPPNLIVNHNSPDTPQNLCEDERLSGTDDGLNRIFDSVVKSALVELAQNPIPIFTFAFYHDHESHAISVCVDTRVSSRICVQETNQWMMQHFIDQIRVGDLDNARLHQANIGRSLSLGNFSRVNLARTNLPENTTTDNVFYIAMARALIKNQDPILEFSDDPEDVIFCCSTATAEVGLVWSRLPTAEQVVPPNGP